MTDKDKNRRVVRSERFQENAIGLLVQRKGSDKLELLERAEKQR